MNMRLQFRPADVIGNESLKQSVLRGVSSTPKVNTISVTRDQQIAARMVDLAGKWTQGSEFKLDTLMKRGGLTDLGWRIDHDLTTAQGLVLVNGPQVRVAYSTSGQNFLAHKAAYVGAQTISDGAGKAGEFIGGELGKKLAKNAANSLYQLDGIQARAQIESIASKYGSRPSQLHGHGTAGAKAIVVGDQMNIPSTTFNPVYSNDMSKPGGQTHSVVRTDDDLFSMPFDMFKNEQLKDLSNKVGADFPTVDLDRFDINNVGRQPGEWNSDLGNFTTRGPSAPGALEQAMNDQFINRIHYENVKDYFEALDKEANTGRWAQNFLDPDFDDMPQWLKEAEAILKPPSPGFSRQEFQNTSSAQVAERFEPGYAETLRNMSSEERSQFIRQLELEGQAQTAEINNMMGPQQEYLKNTLLERVKNIATSRLVADITGGVLASLLLDNFAPTVIKDNQLIYAGVKGGLGGYLGAYIYGLGQLGSLPALATGAAGGLAGVVGDWLGREGAKALGANDLVAGGAGVALGGASAAVAVSFVGALLAGSAEGGLIGAMGGPGGIAFGAGFGALIGLFFYTLSVLNTVQEVEEIEEVESELVGKRASQPEEHDEIPKPIYTPLTFGS